MRVKHRVKHTPFSQWRYYTGCTFSFVTFVLVVVSFVTPYWLKSWSRIHTPFDRLGLWEFCLKGYLNRVDQDMISYFDCWWILSPYYGKVFSQLVPFWFLIIQVLLSVSLALQVVLFVLLIVYLCERIRHLERRIFAMSTIAFGHGLTACALFPAIVVFGANYDNPDWMPYPKFNWPSWSYGCAILANFSSIFTSVCFGLITRETKRDLEDYTMEFPMSTRLRHRRRWWPHKRRWAEDAEPFENQPPDDHRVPPVGDTIPLSELSSTKTSEQREYSGSNSGLTYPESIPGSVHEPPHSRTYKGRSDL